MKDLHFHHQRIANQVERRDLYLVLSLNTLNYVCLATKNTDTSWLLKLAVRGMRGWKYSITDSTTMVNSHLV